MLSSPWLDGRAARSPDHPALEVEGSITRYDALASQAARTAAALRARGIEPGERLAVLMRGGARFVALLHAADRVGAELLSLNLRLTTGELAFQLEQARVTRLLCDAACEPAARAAARATHRHGVEILDEASLDAPATGETSPRDADDPFALLFTSGTTGSPKAVSLTRGNFFWSAIGSALHLGVLPGDRWLACMPLYHVGGLSICWRSVLYGTTVLVHERFDAERVAHALDHDDVTLVSLTATMLGRILERRAGRPAPPGLRCVLLGGGPSPASLLAEASAAGFRLAPTYGLTEACSQVATRVPGSAADGGLTPLPGTELRIRDAGPDGAGEILVRGPTVMRGYADDPEATQRALRDGWLHTGDQGRLDARGTLRVLDRRSDLILSGGENIYPAEVEQTLGTHPRVAEVGVAGVDDVEFGRRPAAWFVPRGDGEAPSDDELRAFCRERLAGFKVPVAFHRVHELPRDAAGKLLRRRLAQRSP